MAVNDLGGDRRVTTIRPMRRSDFAELRDVDAEALLSLYRLPSGTRKMPVTVAFYHRIEPSGCFVAERAGVIVGYLFARAFGSFACIGPMGVLPAYQRRGIGSALIARCIERYRFNPLLGLEAMVGKNTNIGFYKKQSFEVVAPTYIYHKKMEGGGVSGPEPRSPAVWVGETGARYRLEYLSTGTNGGGVGGDAPWEPMRRLCDQIMEGLDFRPIIDAVHEMDIGETLLLWKNDNLCAFATVITAPMVTGAVDLQIKHLIVDRNCSEPALLKKILWTIEALAVHQKKRWVILTISGAAERTAAAVETAGYQRHLRFMRMAHGASSAVTAESGYHIMFWGG